MQVLGGVFFNVGWADPFHVYLEMGANGGVKMVDGQQNNVKGGGG